MRPGRMVIRRAKKPGFRTSRISSVSLLSRLSTARMRPKRSARFFMIRWKIAVARNDCAIREKFGDNVARIVDGCTDTDQTPKPPWLERKRAYLEHLKDSDSSTRLVSASDKLHNTRAILAALRRNGLEVFERFAGKKDGTLWYYRALVTAFRQHGDHADLIDELDRVVSEIEKFVREP